MSLPDISPLEPPPFQATKRTGASILLASGVLMVLGTLFAHRLFLLGMLWSAVSVVATFGALAVFPALVRLPIAAAVSLIAWGLLLAGLGMQWDSATTAAWACLVGLQFTLVAAGAWLLRVWLRAAQGESLSQRLGQYSLAVMMGWMTLIALALGLLRLAIWAFGWDSKIVEWNWFFHLLFLGAWNALLACTSLASVLGAAQPKARYVLALGVPALLVGMEPFLMGALFRQVGASRSDLWFLGGVQTIALLVTFESLLRIGGLDDSHPSLRSSAKT